jgi:hypothetical protein
MTLPLILGVRVFGCSGVQVLMCSGVQVKSVKNYSNTSTQKASTPKHINT